MMIHGMPMLGLNNRVNSSPPPNPSVRYVGRYAYTFAGATVNVATINSGDLTLTGANKQLVIACIAESPTLESVTIDGVRAVMCCADVSQFVTIWTGPRVGTGNVVVQLDAGSSATESNSILVWEVTDAAPIYQGYGIAAHTALLASVTERFMPLGASGIGMSYNATDTATCTWTNMTEDADADAGDSRITGAHNTSAAGSDTRDQVTATWSTATGRSAHVNAIRSDDTGIKGSKLISSVFQNVGTAGIGTGFESLDNHTGAGSFKLVVFVGFENDVTITAAEYDGSVAMTLLGSVFNTGASPDLRIYCYAVDITQGNPTGDISFDLSGVTSDSYAFAMYRLYGVGSVGTPGSQQGNAAGASFTLNVNQGGVIIGMSIRATDTQTTTWTGLTEIVDVDSGNYARSDAIRWQCAAETGRTIQASGSGSGQYATLAIPFNP